MRKSGCSKQKLRAPPRLRNGGISRFQRCLKMGSSTGDFLWQIAESIPELLNHEEHDYEIQITRRERTAGLRSGARHYDFRRRVGMGSPEAEARKVYETYREAGGNFLDTANFY